MPSADSSVRPEATEAPVSIIAFHRILISTAIVFCGLFSAWQAASFFREGLWLGLVLGLAFGAAALGLVYYLAHLDRFLGNKTSS